MPHSTSDEAPGLDITQRPTLTYAYPSTNSLTPDASDSEDSSSSENQKLSYVTDRLGPFELEGTPMHYHHSSFRHSCPLLSQEALDIIANIVEEAKTRVQTAAQEYRSLLSAYRYLDNCVHCEESTTDHCDYPNFVQMLKDEGLDHLLEYIDQLDCNANFAVTSTADPNKKRCKVGRPKGKILRQVQGDSLPRRLCVLHLDEVGFRQQVQGDMQRPSWVCWPPNTADEDVED